MFDINWIAVLVAALAAFVLGGLWYGPLFGKKWMTLNKISPEDIAQSNMAVTYGLAFVLSFIAAIGMAVIMPDDMPFNHAPVFGFAVGFAFVMASFGISYLFESRPFALWLINGFYHVLQFTLYAVILALI